MAVTDSHGLVPGVTGLRVIDASRMPTPATNNTDVSIIISGNVVATAAERSQIARQLSVLI